MCGIAGILTRHHVDEQPLRRMLAALVHRGPDDEGIYHVSRVACHASLGMRRLAIIDISGGHQPMFNEDGTLAIVFNGEIYNFMEVRDDLQRRGHRFRTCSDTEVILHAYEEWGPACVHRLRGMFAFAIWDGREETEDGRPCLFLARDRLGIKPLYYYREDGRFLFASEVRALLASGLVPFHLDLNALYAYLLFGSVQEPLTLVQGVYSLPPGHWMVVPMNAEGKAPLPSATLHRYWDFPTAARADRTPQEVMETIRQHLSAAVRLRLIADVPLGAFLSGGIDSAAVVSLMRATGQEVPRTFTVVFQEREYDERDVARVTARRFDTAHTEVVVTADQVLAELPQALAAMDQPTMDGINTYYVSRAARQAGLTVALSGLGGDEVFAGYPTFRTVPRLLRLQRVMPRAWPSFDLPYARLPFSPSVQKLAAFLAHDMAFGHPYFLARALFTPSQAKHLLTSQARERLQTDTPWHHRVQASLTKAQEYDPLNMVSYLECTHYMLSTLLRDTDQMSMAHSLEVRVPLIDHELVEFMFTLPGPWKIRPPQSPISTLQSPPSKPLLVHALNGALPPEVAYRRKSTFTFPWEAWLRGSLREEVERVLGELPAVLKDVIDPRAVRLVWDAFQAGRTTWSRPWALYVLFRWLSKIEG